MSTWPEGARWLMGGFEEVAEPGVVRTEMERGVPKMRVVNSRVMCELTGTIVFLTKGDATAFESWFYGDLNRIGWFSMRHPRTGDTITARFKDGRLGGLQPVAPAFAASARSVTLEYLRG